MVTRGKIKSTWKCKYSIAFHPKATNVWYLAGLLTRSSIGTFPFVRTVVHANEYDGAYSYGDSLGFSPNSLLIHRWNQILSKGRQ